MVHWKGYIIVLIFGETDFCVVNLLDEVVPRLNIKIAEEIKIYERKIEHWNSEDRYDLMNKAEKGVEFELDLECGGRDGLFDNEAKYAIYNKSDLLKLINKLQEIYNQY